MLGMAQSFTKIHIKIAHSHCCFHFPLLSLAYFATSLLPFCWDGWEKQTRRITTCTGWQRSWPSWSYARKAWYLTRRETSSPFLCSEVSSSQIGVKAGILASFPVHGAACLLLTQKTTVRCQLLHMMCFDFTVLMAPHQDKFKPTMWKGVTP